MSDKITFPKWIDNPSNSRSRLVGEKDIAQATYNNKYNKMMLMCAGKINFWLFHDETKKYLIYIQMPSERVKTLTYDVVIEFTTDDDVKMKINKLDDYHVRFFSNDPNFVFTYAHAYSKRELLIPYLKNKISQKALNTEPKTTNPLSMVGYVKSIYFAYIFMRNRGLFNKLNWLSAGSMTQAKQILDQHVMHSDKKLIQAQSTETIFKQASKGAKVRINKSSKGDLEAMSTAAKNATNQVNYTKRVKTVDRNVHNKFKKAKTAHVVGKG